MQLNFANISYANQTQNLQNVQFRANLSQPAFLTPQKQPQNVEFLPNHIHQQSQRIMYKSTIQPFNTSNIQNQPIASFGLGKLANMGRAIQQTDEEQKKFPEKPTVIHPQQPKTLAFRTDRPERAKMAASMMLFNNKTHQRNANFPLFHDEPVRQSQPPKGIQSLMSKAKIVHQEIQLTQTPQDKRTRQIFEIKQQMDKLSNRFEGFRPKNTPAFVPPQQQQVTHLTFFKSTSQQTQMPLQGNTNEFSLKLTKGNSEQNNFNVRVNPQNQPNLKPIQPTQNICNETKYNKLQQINDLYKKTSSLSASTNASIESQCPSLKEQTGMFKKKNVYIEPQGQKTNQNLLKMLGINIKTSNSKQQAVSSNKEGILLQKPAKTFTLTQPYSPPTTVYEGNTVKQSKQTQTQKKITKSDFKIGKKMGKGQFGEVMLVQHRITGFLCGMKVMSKKQIKSQKYQNQIARELSIQFYLQHRNVAPLYGYFEDQQNLYLLVQFCTDGQLLEMIRKNRRMQENEVSPIIRQICQGLDYVHKQEIIHRDVKPENILFNFGTVKISDFGWAVHCGNGMRRTVSGSPLYYSPEIVLQTQYDEKIDIWSIGMMAYECLLGKIPFRIYSEFDLNRIVQDQIKFPEYVDVTDQAKDFILRIMKKKPQERMEIKQMMRHPFITKYLKQRKVAPSIMEQFRKILSQ